MNRWIDKFPKGKHLELCLSIYLLLSLALMAMGRLFHMPGLMAMGAILLLPVFLIMGLTLLFVLVWLVWSWVDPRGRHRRV